MDHPTGETSRHANQESGITSTVHPGKRTVCYTHILRNHVVVAGLRDRFRTKRSEEWVVEGGGLSSEVFKDAQTPAQ